VVSEKVFHSTPMKACFMRFFYKFLICIFLWLGKSKSTMMLIVPLQ
jgi:hypothetical protein